MRSLPANAWRYVSERTRAGCAPDADALFRAITEDLLADGDVEKAMQKAFRWGYTDEDGEEVPGLRDLVQGLRKEREELEQHVRPAAEDAPVDAEDGGEAGPAGEDALQAGERQDVSGRVTQLQQLERSLRQVESLDDLNGFDPQLVDTLLDDEEKAWLDAWASMTGTLVDAGLVVEGAKRLELSPEAIRRIGARALRSIYLPLGSNGAGEHDLHQKGDRGPTTDTSAPWQFGQPFTLHLTRTVLNAVSREGIGRRVRLRPEDFEALDREGTSATATVLLIDMSRSMFHNGAWDAAKRSTLALDTLIRTMYPRDVLEIVGFSESAQRLSLSQLPSLTWDEFSHGTNLQAGLALARQRLRPHATRDRQVILVTDGEPTAFTEDGETIFENPATERTFEATLREVGRCTRDRMGITTFLLDESPDLVDFVTRMTRINRGRVVQAHPKQLGRYLVHDFQHHRSSIVG